MDKLVAKSKKLTNYLLFLLDSIETDRIEIITPEERGCQLSIRVKNGNKTLFDKIEKGEVNTNISEKFNLKDASKAHMKLQSRNTTGSIVLKP